MIKLKPVRTDIYKNQTYKQIQNQVIWTTRNYVTEHAYEPIGCVTHLRLMVWIGE